MTTEAATTDTATSHELRDLRALPKGHLHLHMEAGIRRSTLDELSAELGIVVPMIENFSDFTEFSQTYRGILAVLNSEKNLFRLIDECFDDAAAEGVFYAEFGASPHFYAGIFGSIELALEAMIAKCDEASARTGVKYGLMITVDRVESADAGVAYAKIAASFAGRGVVSLGLANDERGYPAERFGEAFAIAKDAGLQSTPHAGELVGPESVWAALDVLKADRILHGVLSVSDPALLERLAADGICLDVCPTSNLLLSVIPEIDAHPLVTLLEAGVRCSINADDPILFGPNILSEYELCRSVLKLTDAQLAACAWSSIDCTSLPADAKAEAKVRIDAWLAA